MILRAPYLSLVVVTTLLDADEYTSEDLAELYHQRWLVELDIRAIKQSLAMDKLRCKTPLMVEREIWAHFLGYNLVRKVSQTSNNVRATLAVPLNTTTTASDALWTGLPVVTCSGDTFAGRVAGSLLTAIGLPELVTRSLAEYEQLALALARDPPRLTALRQKLQGNRDTSALFDLPKLTGNIEAAYLRMWQTWLSGDRPAAFSIQDGRE